MSFIPTPILTEGPFAETNLQFQSCLRHKPRKAKKKDKTRDHISLEKEQGLYMIHQLTVCTHIALIYIDLPPSFQIINSEILPNGSY